LCYFVPFVVSAFRLEHEDAPHRLLRQWNTFCDTLREDIPRSLMEQPCYKCGQTVEEGIPFCPHCAAPQIRVVVAEPAPPPLAIAAETMQGVLPASQTVPVLALPMQWSQALKPCVLAGVVASGLMLLGLHPFVAMVCVGFLAVIFYRQSRPEIMLKAKTGAGLGALAGLLWFAMSSVIEALVVLVFHKGAELRTALLTKIQEAASQTSDPQILAMFERFKTQAGLEFLMIAGLICAFLASIALGGLGGALGGAILGRRRRPNL
jgi:hypothetical protein